MTDNELRGQIEAILALLEHDPAEFTDDDRRAVRSALAAVEPELRRRNLNSDLNLTRRIVEDIKPSSRLRRETLARAHRAAYGLKIALG